MVRYSLLRLLIFFGCLGLLWLVGLRDPDQRAYLVNVVALLDDRGPALLSMIVSFFVLSPFREEAVGRISERVEARTAARSQRVTDEDVEDSAGADDYR